MESQPEILAVPLLALGFASELSGALANRADSFFAENSNCKFLRLYPPDQLNRQASSYRTIWLPSLPMGINPRPAVAPERMVAFGT